MSRNTTGICDCDIIIWVLVKCGIAECGMRKVKCGIEKCGNGCGTVGKMWNAETVCGESKPAEQSWKTRLEMASKSLYFLGFSFLV